MHDGERRARAVGRRAVRREGSRGLRGHAHDAGVELVCERSGADGPTRSTSADCAPRVRSRSGRPRRPSSARGRTPASPLLGTDAQPMGHLAYTGRIERWDGSGSVGGHGAVRYRERRRRIDPNARELHRPRRTEEHLRADPDVRRHADRAELGGRSPRHHRRRHRVVARRDGRAGPA